MVAPEFSLLPAVRTAASRAHLALLTRGGRAQPRAPLASLIGEGEGAEETARRGGHGGDGGR